MNETRLNFLTTQACKKWGKTAQMIKTVEECAELSQQLCKYVNGSPLTFESIIDEIADVTIMVHQMQIIFGTASVNERINYKLDRLEKALNKTPDTGKGV